MSKWSFVALVVACATVLGATLMREPVAWAAQYLTISNTPAEAVPVRGVGRVILVADNLVVPPRQTVAGPWVDTSDCQRLLLRVRGTEFVAGEQGVEFYTSMDGVTRDTFWTQDLPPDTRNYDAIAGGGTTFSFSFRGRQAAAAPFAQVTFSNPDETAQQTVDKGWIYCIR